MASLLSLLPSRRTKCVRTSSKTLGPSQPIEGRRARTASMEDKRTGITDVQIKQKQNKTKLGEKRARYDITLLRTVFLSAKRCAPPHAVLGSPNITRPALHHTTPHHRWDISVDYHAASPRTASSLTSGYCIL